jgi:hypothetical protein
MGTSLTDRELAHVLAGLRLLQSESHVPAPIDDIRTNGGRHAPMSPSEIDDLCEKLNIVPVSGGRRQGTRRSGHG